MVEAFVTELCWAPTASHGALGFVLLEPSALAAGGSVQPCEASFKAVMVKWTF